MKAKQRTEWWKIQWGKACCTSRTKANQEQKTAKHRKSRWKSTKSFKQERTFEAVEWIGRALGHQWRDHRRLAAFGVKPPKYKVEMRSENWKATSTKRKITWQMTIHKSRANNMTHHHFELYRPFSSVSSTFFRPFIAHRPARATETR